MKGTDVAISRPHTGDEYWVFPGGGVEEGETPERKLLKLALTLFGFIFNQE